MTKASDNAYPSLLITEGTVPSSPAAGKQRLYIDSSTHAYKTVNSSGTTTAIGGSSTTVATDTLWDAAGDLAVGTGADTAAKLAIGTAGKSLVSNGTTAAWGYQYGTLLAMAVINTSANYTTTSSTMADTNASVAITYTAPASGNVLVRIGCTVKIDAANNNAFLGLRESTTDLGASKYFAVQGQTAAAVEIQISVPVYLTGVSAGSHTYKVSYGVNGGGTFIVRSFANNPVTLEVWSAP